jgi:hypothetical protein
MDLIDILTRQTKIVENDDEWDEMEDHGAKQGEIIRKVLQGLSKLMENIDEDVIGEVLFGGTSAGGADHDRNHIAGTMLFAGILHAYGVDMDHIETSDLVTFFKALGLSRGEAEYVKDQN